MSGRTKPVSVSLGDCCVVDACAALPGLAALDDAEDFDRLSAAPDPTDPIDALGATGGSRLKLPSVLESPVFGARAWGAGVWIGGGGRP